MCLKSGKRSKFAAMGLAHNRYKRLFMGLAHRWRWAAPIADIYRPYRARAGNIRLICV